MFAAAENKSRVDDVSRRGGSAPFGVHACGCGEEALQQAEADAVPER